MATSIDTESGLNHGTETVHETVLLQEAVDVLVTDKSGVYIDGTFGRGGHSRLLLSCLSEQGRVIATDRDPAAIAAAVDMQKEEPRLQVLHAEFARRRRSQRLF